MSNFGKRYQALGRLKRGERNKTEAAYERFLQEQLAAGLIIWFRFEGIKLRLADNTFVTIDFAVQQLSGVIELHDSKGAAHLVTDTARLRYKVAREMYPFDIFLAYPRAKKDGGGWNLEEI